MPPSPTAPRKIHRRETFISSISASSCQLFADEVVRRRGHIDAICPLQRLPMSFWLRDRLHRVVRTPSCR